MFPIEKMCEVLDVSRSSYYKWISRKPSNREIENKKITSLIKEAYQESKGRYGSPKIAEELKEKGKKVSRARVARIMKKEGIVSIVNKKFRLQTTDSKHNLPVCENILNREFDRESPSEALVSDISYFPTVEGWVYLTIVMDLYDRRIIGWSLSDDMTTENTVLAAWRMARTNRLITNKTIFHSDRGSQYCSHAFTNELACHGVIQSMSRKANCWDNAIAENFFGILKKEMGNYGKHKSRLDAKLDIFDFIEIWYNRKRRHSCLGYRSPEQFFKINLMNVA